MPYTLPKLTKVNENKQFFQFYDGSISKIFKSATPYHYSNIDDDGKPFYKTDYAPFYKVVNLDDSTEIMDTLGNFTKEPTKLGVAFYNYYDSNISTKTTLTRLLSYQFDEVSFKVHNFIKDLPVDYFADEKFLAAVKSLEYTMFAEYEKNNMFHNSISKLIYKHKVKKAIKVKLKKLEFKQDLIKFGEINYYEFYNNIYKGGLDY